MTMVAASFFDRSLILREFIVSQVAWTMASGSVQPRGDVPKKEHSTQEKHEDRPDARAHTTATKKSNEQMVRPKTFVPLTILTFVLAVKLYSQDFPLKRKFPTAPHHACSPKFSPRLNLTKSPTATVQPTAIVFSSPLHGIFTMR